MDRPKILGATLPASSAVVGRLTPIEVTAPDGEAQRAAERLQGVKGVYAAVAPEGPAWHPEGTALVSVLPRSETSTATGKDTVEKVRRIVGAEFPQGKVGGGGAFLIAATRALYGGLPILLGAVGTPTFVLLARAFRPVVLALQAIVLDLLSIGAAYGVMVLVWQHGYGSDAIWVIPATGAITAWVPPMTFAFLFGLSMDYEVFLLSRMREECDECGSTRNAVVEGLGRTGRLVTSAAPILFLTFTSLAGVSETDVKIMATGLGTGRSCWMPPWCAPCSHQPGLALQPVDVVAASPGRQAAPGPSPEKT